MKLSRIIELALVKHYGVGDRKFNFMCHAVEELQEEDLITKKQLSEAHSAIYEMISTIDKGCTALVSALHRTGIVEEDRCIPNMPYTTQLYVWWVFDLKNKGL